MVYNSSKMFFPLYLVFAKFVYPNVLKQQVNVHFECLICHCFQSFFATGSNNNNIGLHVLFGFLAVVLVSCVLLLGWRYKKHRGKQKAKKNPDIPLENTDTKEPML